MATPRSLGGHALSGIRRPMAYRGSIRRAMATASSDSYAYQTGDIDGLKFASRDLPGPTTTVVTVARAGARYQWAPGLSDGLAKFMFRSTNKRSSLRITRESELLGGRLVAYETREHVVVGAKFLRDDLPYFTELLAEVMYQTAYHPHEFKEDVAPNMRLARQLMVDDSRALANDAIHRVAFHRGLGNSLHPVLPTPLPGYFSGDTIRTLGALAFDKKNCAVVCNGASPQDFGKWMGEFFKGAEAPKDDEGKKAEDVASIVTEQSKYFGGEERIEHDGTSAMVLGFAGTSNFTGKFWKPEIPVLAALLGGQTTIKWSPGFSLLSKATQSSPSVKVSTSSFSYSDAGLLAVTISGHPGRLANVAEEVVKVIKKVATGDVSKEEVKKAVANAKFDEMSKLQELTAGLEQAASGLITGDKTHQITEVAKSLEGVTENSLKKVAQTLLEGKASVASIGNLFLLPYASEIGLNV